MREISAVWDGLAFEGSPVGTRVRWKIAMDPSRLTRALSPHFRDQDFMTTEFADPLRRAVPGTHGQPEITIEKANHYVQDDTPQALAAEILALIERTT